MQKFMCVHTLAPHAITREQVQQFQQASQLDPDVRGYRSFINLTEGKVLCVLEARSKDALASWFSRMGLPFDSITPVEMEGERGSMLNIEQETTSSQIHA